MRARVAASLRPIARAISRPEYPCAASMRLVRASGGARSGASCRRSHSARVSERPTIATPSKRIAKALKPHGVEKEDVPSPLNVFQTMVINVKTGSMRYSMTRPRPGGDMMDLRAEMDCLVGISACPEGGRGKDLRVLIYR